MKTKVRTLSKKISQESCICKRGPSLCMYKISPQKAVLVLNSSAAQKLAPVTYAMRAQIRITPVK